MKVIDEFSDRRHLGSCILCDAASDQTTFTRDHIPSRSLLDPPFPDNLSTFDICHECNNGLSGDEEYLRVFLTCVLEGTSDPDRLRNEPVARAIRRNARLAEELRRARRDYDTAGGGSGSVWTPDMDRLLRALLKNARGHFIYELGERPLGEPRTIAAVPLQQLSAEQRATFERVSLGDVWPEVGSRMMTRMAWLATGEEGPDMKRGWIVVQPGVYRYAVHDFRAVRMVLREYLAFEAIWE